MFKCKSGRHTWNDEISARRCCNGWHREFRPGSWRSNDDLHGSVNTEDGTLVWVPDELKPVVFENSQDSCLVNIVLEREYGGDDLPVMEDNFKSGKITADPKVHIHEAIAQQVALELQEACDQVGLNGHFRITQVHPNRSML